MAVEIDGANNKVKTVTLAFTDGDTAFTIADGGGVTVSTSLDMNGTELILDADADTSITADTDDQIDFKAGGTDIMSLTATTATINDGLTVSVSDNTDTLRLISTDADENVGPVLVLHRNSASPADNDVLGNIIFAGEDSAGNETDFLRLDVQASDKTNGAEDVQLRIMGMLASAETEFIRLNPSGFIFNEGSVNLNFRIESNGDANMLFVDGGNDRVGIGTGSPATTFHVEASEHNNTSVEFRHSGDGSSNYPYGLAMRFNNSNRDNNTEYFYYATDSSGLKFVVYSDGDVKNHDNSYGSTSDERIKQDIRDSNSQWDDIKAVKVRNFKKKDDVRQYGDKAWEQIGVIAQELEAAGMDKLVKESDPTPADILSDSSFGTLYEDGDTIPDGKAIGDVKEVKATVKGVSYSVLYMKAIKALQEAMAKIETLETKVKALEDA